MRYLSLSFLVFIGLLTSMPAGGLTAQAVSTPLAPQSEAAPTGSAGGQVAILSPQAGQTLQGGVPVVVDTKTEGFKSVELYFSYAKDSRATWFLIYQGVQPVTGTMLVLWDTSTITDGDYTLKMVVTFADGSQKTALTADVRVRNYTPVETSTPLPPKPSATRLPAVTLQPTVGMTEKPSPPIVTVTAVLSRNPAEIEQQDVLQSIGMGIAAVLGLFLLGAAYSWMRGARHRK